MSDTPETDAVLYRMNGADIVWFDFARKLEQERDEARLALREAIQFRNTSMSGYDLEKWMKAAGLEEKK